MGHNNSVPDNPVVSDEKIQLNEGPNHAFRKRPVLKEFSLVGKRSLKSSEYEHIASLGTHLIYGHYGGKDEGRFSVNLKLAPDESILTHLKITGWEKDNDQFTPHGEAIVNIREKNIGVDIGGKVREANPSGGHLLGGSSPSRVKARLSYYFNDDAHLNPTPTVEPKGWSVWLKTTSEFATLFEKAPTVQIGGNYITDLFKASLGAQTDQLSGFVGFPTQPFGGGIKFKYSKDQLKRNLEMKFTYGKSKRNAVNTADFWEFYGVFQPLKKILRFGFSQHEKIFSWTSGAFHHITLGAEILHDESKQYPDMPVNQIIMAGQWQISNESLIKAKFNLAGWAHGVLGFGLGSNPRATLGVNLGYDFVKSKFTPFGLGLTFED